jgi:hypothetical protein
MAIDHLIWMVLDFPHSTTISGHVHDKFHANVALRRWWAAQVRRSTWGIFSYL